MDTIATNDYGHPNCVHRYVNDYLVFARKNETQNILNAMNNFDRMLKFTVEKTKNGELNFLDTTIFSDENGILQLKTYIKPSASEVKVNFQDSICPKKYQISTLVTDLHRCFNTCTTELELNKSLNVMGQIYEKNGFPRKLIQEKTRNLIERNFQQNPQNLTALNILMRTKILFYNILAEGVISLPKTLQTHNTKVSYLFLLAHN